MSKLDEDIALAIQDITDKSRGRRFPVMSGKVVAGTLDNSAKTVSVVLSINDESGPTPDVLLNAVSLNNSGVIMYPADGSDVWVAEIDGQGKYGIIKCSTLEKIELTASTVISFNGGENGGIPIAGSTATKITGAINSINNLRTAINSWVAIPNDGGAALKVALTAWLAETLATVAAGDIENVDVKH